MTVAAGDLIGASPLLSAAFHDEPTIEAMNKMGLQITSVGNHEFDEGWRELVRMQKGGCLDDGAGKDNQNSCADHTFTGAKFRYLSANVFHEDTGKTRLPGRHGQEVRRREGRLHRDDAGEHPEHRHQVRCRRACASPTRWRPPTPPPRSSSDRASSRSWCWCTRAASPSDPTAYNSCPGISGPILDINKGLSPRIDAVITGHTHQAYNCQLKDPNDDNRLVTSGSSLGRLITDIDLSIDKRTGDVIRSSEKADNVIVTNGADVHPADSIISLIGTYQSLVAPIANKVIGHLSGTTSVTRTNDASGESPLGNLIADAQKADPTPSPVARPRRSRS